MIREETLTVFGILYTWSSEDDYKPIEDPDIWADFIKTCRQEAHAAHADDASSILDKPLPYERYKKFASAILTPGIPGSVLPVESLYKPWSENEETAVGSKTGYYMGDHARHIVALCDSLGIGIPEHFAGTPDHLVLLLELYSFLEENGSQTNVREFVESHLDWLPDYIEALSQREALEPDPELAASIRFYRELTGVMKEMIDNKTREGE